MGFTFFKCGQIWTYFCLILGVLIYFKSLIQYCFPRFVCDPIIWLLANPQLWKALAYSLTMAPTAGILSVLFAFFLLLLSRQLQWLYHPKLAHLILAGGMMILAIPTIVLAVGLFLWLQDIDFQQGICLWWYLFVTPWLPCHL